METNGKRSNGTFAPGHKFGNRFKKGETANPNGRPVGSKNVSTVLKELLQQMAPGDVVGSKFIKEFCKGRKQVTNAEAIVARLLYAAIIKGDLKAIKEIVDRAEGKAMQRIDMDMQVADWREVSEATGIAEIEFIREMEDVTREAKAELLLGESTDGGGGSSDD
jgi:hypothetical protein